MTRYTSKIQNDLIAQLAQQELLDLDFSLYTAPELLPIMRSNELGFNYVTVLSNDRLVTAGRKVLAVWDISSRECLKTLIGHTKWINGVATLPNGHVVSASADETLKVWDVTSGECLNTLIGHTDHVSSVATLSDGKIVSASADKTLKVWEVTSGKCIKTLRGHTKEVRYVAQLPDGRVLSTSWDNTLKLWDIQSWKCQKTLRGNDDFNFVKVVQLPDGQLVSCTDSGMLKVWDIATGKCKKRLHGHTAIVNGLVVLPNGQLVSGSEDNTLKIWDIAAGVCLKTLKVGVGCVMDMAILPNGKIMSVSGDTLTICRLMPSCLSYTEIAPVLTAIMPSSRLKRLSCRQVDLSQEGYNHILRLIETLEFLEEVDVSDTNLTLSQLNTLQQAVRNKFYKGQRIVLKGLGEMNKEEAFSLESPPSKKLAISDRLTTEIQNIFSVFNNNNASPILSQNELSNKKKMAEGSLLSSDVKVRLSFTQHTKAQPKTLPEPGNKTRNTSQVERIILENEDLAKLAKKQAEKEKDFKNLGDAGESHVYFYLKDLLTNQMGITPSDLPQETPGSRFAKGKIIVDLKWFNKDRKNNVLITESPIDLVIAVNGIDKYFIEVKSTDSPTNPFFYLTSNEWQYMRVYGEKSILVRVYEARTNKPRFELFKNPYGMIFDDFIKFGTGGRFQLAITADANIAPYTLENYEDLEIGCKIQ